jgi:DNA-binding MarR family transcriptional regulator
VRDHRSQQALVAIRRILRATEFSAKRLARSAGLTTSQLVVLQILTEEGEATPGTISARVGLSHATVTTLIDRLEKRGFVARRRGEDDRRKVWIELTPEGRTALAGLPDTLQHRFQTRFADLPDWERAYIVAALERVAALLDAEHIDAAPVLDLGDIGSSPEDERVDGRIETRITTDADPRG